MMGVATVYRAFKKELAVVIEDNISESYITKILEYKASLNLKLKFYMLLCMCLLVMSL